MGGGGAYIEAVLEERKRPGGGVREAYQVLGWGLYFTGKHEAALERFTQYLKAGGTDPNASRGRAFALFRLGRYKAAVPDLEAAIAAEDTRRLLPITEVVPIPGTKAKWAIAYNARSTLAWLYYRTGEAARAEAEFRSVLKAYPFWVDALTGLGYSLLAEKKLAEAEERFLAALNVSPGYPDARQGLTKLKEGRE